MFVCSSLVCLGFSQSSSTLCISTDGLVYSLGCSDVGTHGHENKQVLIPKAINGLSDIKNIPCGYYHVACIDYDGNIFTFGKNEYGQIGIGKTVDELKFTHIPQKLNLPPIKYVSCGDEFTVCISDEGNMYSFGYGREGQLGLGNNETYSSPQLIPDLNNIEFIQCGIYYTISKTYNYSYIIVFLYYSNI